MGAQGKQRGGGEGRVGIASLRENIQNLTFYVNVTIPKLLVRTYIRVLDIFVFIMSLARMLQITL